MSTPNILISATELKGIIEQPETVLFDCRYNLAEKSAGLSSYQAGHIPGAVYADLEKNLSGKINPNSGRHPIPIASDFEQFLQSAGVNRNSVVVVYDEISGPFAARMFWLCRWAGLNTVRILDGGYRAWINEKYQVEQISPEKRKGTVELTLNHVTTFEMKDIKDNLASNQFTVVDAREPHRFNGVEEGIDSVAGHIPGAQNAFFKDNISADGKFKSAEELKYRFTKLMFNEPDKIVHSCGSGVTACHNYLAMEIAGLTGSGLYIGSWSEWITDPLNPIKKNNT